ncbi:hypothetical protein FF38_04666 [Lucilia cuprina]|uniref:Cyclin-dependent kinase 2-interacting protein n=1 Tax=Lucilia cuprina TaxID=7375 RepID=A0A0L0BQZ3_LUCCU|nr:hypothetical protein FF38_04666 [Lucilia cuprina]
MVSTPTKTQDSTISPTLTPVRFLDSPKGKTCSTSDSNVAACKSRLEVIVKTIEDNFNKWQLAEKRGLALCTSIEAIKTKALDKLNTNDNSSQVTSYPDELKLYCDKLAIIASIFEDITKNARESLRQLKALSKLPGSCNEIFYRSWDLNNFIEFLTELLERYEKESKVKKHVSEHLPHGTTRSDLIRSSTAWEYPQHVDSYVHLMFLFFKEEINLKK